MTLVAARRSLDARYVYLEGDDYVAKASRRQMSALFAKSPPFLTGAYLDEVALAAALAPAGAPLVVFGGGFGSTYPLCLSALADLRIISVDRDAEAARAGAHFCSAVLAKSRAAAIEWRVARVEDVAAELLPRAGAVFVDLYDDDRVSEAILDPRLHPAPFALINVFDAGYRADGPCATTAVAHALSCHYAAFFAARRRRSSILIASTLPAPELFARIGAARARLDAQGVPPAKTLDQVSPIAPAEPFSKLFSLGTPSTPRSLDEGDGEACLAERARREIAALEPGTLLALLRTPSAFLDF